MVFMDIDSITPGMDFVQEIERNIDKSDATLVIIGKNWASARNTIGLRRMDDPSDWVVREIVLALQIGKPIIPVLVDGACLPGRADLPPSIAALAERNAFVIRPDHFAEDMQRLIKTFHAWSDDD